MQTLKTENCVICGEKAEYWHGYVKGKEKMALGNHIEKKIIAGFCRLHAHYESETCSYGFYKPDKMGKCIPLF